MAINEICPPHKCAECPVIKSLKRTIDEYDAASLHAMMASEDPDITDEYREKERAEVNTFLANIAIKQKYVDDKATEMAKRCHGPLTMSRDNRSGGVTTVTVCDSLELISGQFDEPATIKREQVE